MPSSKAIQEASSKTFCQRVAVLAMRMAHQSAVASPDDLAQMAYAEHVFRGDERAVVLAMHVVAASAPVAAALETGVDAVTDDAIELALQEIWPLRVAAFGATSMQLFKTRQLVNDAIVAAEALKTTPPTA